MKKNMAILQAVKKSDETKSAWVVVEDSGSWDAIPQAYLSDISYTGPREIVFTVSDPSEVFGYPVSDLSDEVMLSSIDDIVIPAL